MTANYSLARTRNPFALDSIDPPKSKLQSTEEWSEASQQFPTPNYSSAPFDDRPVRNFRDSSQIKLRSTRTTPHMDEEKYNLIQASVPIDPIRHKIHSTEKP